MNLSWKTIRASRSASSHCPNVRASGSRIVAALSLLLVFSCSSGPGTTYRDSVSEDEAAAQKSAAAARAASGSKGGASPSQPRPSSPPGRPSPGGSPGGAPRGSSAGSTSSSQPILIVIPPPQPMGKLVLEGLPRGVEVYVDGLYKFGSELDLAVGTHEVELRAFGMRPFRASVDIDRGRSAVLRPLFEAAPFELLSFDSDRESLDPASPGGLGSLRLSIQASGPGSYSISVRDWSGRSVYRYPEGRLSSAWTELRWNGRDEEGRVLPEGVYRCLLEARGDDGASARLSLALGIAAGRPVRYWASYSGSGGPLLVPEALSLPAGAVQGGLSLIAHMPSPEAAFASTVPALAFLRFGLGERSEFAASVLGVLRLGGQIDTSWGGFSISFKRLLLEGPVSASYVAKLGWRRFLDAELGSYPPSWDGLQNFPGLSLALPIEAGAEGMRFFLSPEIQLSRFYPGWASGPWEAPGLFAFGYLRGGFEALIGRDLGAAVSAALRGEPGFTAIDWPLTGALELHWYGNGSVVSAYALAEIDSVGSFAVYGGFGIGFAY